MYKNTTENLTLILF